MAQCLKFLSPCDPNNNLPVLRKAPAPWQLPSQARPGVSRPWGLGGGTAGSMGRAVHECKKLCARTVLHCGFYYFLFHNHP